jgi:hypothetical protein
MIDTTSTNNNDNINTSTMWDLPVDEEQVSWIMCLISLN